MPKLKNKKYYVTTNTKTNYFYNVSEDIEETKKGLCTTTPYILELTVTKVYTRETDLKEIEVD